MGRGDVLGQGGNLILILIEMGGWTHHSGRCDVDVLAKVGVGIWVHGL